MAAGGASHDSELTCFEKWLWTWKIENSFSTFLLKVYHYGFAVDRWRATRYRVRCHAIPVTGKSVLPNRLLFELTASMILQSISKEISLVFCQLCIEPFRTMEKSTSLTLIWKQNSTDGKCAFQRSKKQYSTTKALTKERFTLANMFVWKLETQEGWQLIHPRVANGGLKRDAAYGTKIYFTSWPQWMRVLSALAAWEVNAWRKMEQQSNVDRVTNASPSRWSRSRTRQKRTQGRFLNIYVRLRIFHQTLSFYVQMRQLEHAQRLGGMCKPVQLVTRSFALIQFGDVTAS